MNTNYPQNLLKRIYEDDFDIIQSDWDEDESRELENILSGLSPLRLMIIERRFKQDDTLKNIGEEMNITRERVRQLEADTIRDIRHTKFIREIARAHGLYNNMEYLDLTTRAYNVLRRYGCNTVDDVKKMINSGRLQQLYGAGVKTIKNIKRSVEV